MREREREREREVNGQSERASVSGTMKSIPKLTPRQREILELHCAEEALTAEAIASRLGIAPSTVRGYIAELHEIFMVSSHHQLFVKALRMGLVSMDDEGA